MKNLTYPLTFKFSPFAFSPEFRITDARGQLVAFVKQKAFKLKEDIKVYADENQQHLRYHIKASHWLDFGAEYHFTDAQDRKLGHVAHHPGFMTTNANYETYLPTSQKVLFCEGYNFWRYLGRRIRGQELPDPALGTSPWYTSELIGRTQEPPVASLNQKSTWTSNTFELVKIGTLSEEEEVLMILSLTVAILLRRSRQRNNG